MSIELSATLRGQNIALNSLRLMQKRTDNPAGLMARLSIIAFQDVMGHFKKQEGAKESGAVPSSWARLKPATIAGRRQGTGAGTSRILQDTGRLRGSIHPGTRGSKQAYVSTNLVYATTHQYGRGRIPARPFLWISKASLEKMTRISIDWVMHGRGI